MAHTQTHKNHTAIYWGWLHSKYYFRGSSQGLLLLRDLSKVEKKPSVGAKQIENGQYRGAGTPGTQHVKQKCSVIGEGRKGRCQWLQSRTCRAAAGLNLLQGR